MHKITRNVMAPEEPLFPTQCSTNPERWFPDEQKPDPFAVAACWSCHFQAGCARRALAQDEEFGVWGGYRLAPGGSLERRRSQLRIIAGFEMGPALPPGTEITAALTVLAALERGDATAAEEPASADTRRVPAGPLRAPADLIYAQDEVRTEPVQLDDWREPTAADMVSAAAEERAAMADPLSGEYQVDAHGQILMSGEGWDSAPTAKPSRQPRRRTESAPRKDTAIPMFATAS